MSVATTQNNYGDKFDYYTKIVPFDAKLYHSISSQTKKFKIGYFKSLDDIEPSPASCRAISEVIELLKN